MRLRTALATPLLVAACGGVVEPEAVLGAWYLETYNGAAVPGTAVFHEGSDSSLIEIDSVRLVVETGFTCTWLVDLGGAPANGTDVCVWTLDADPDAMLVTIEGGFQLRGDATFGTLGLRDSNDNLLVFSRDPTGSNPEEPRPRRSG
jgi:hypothetical protein